MPRSRPISGASTDAAVAASAVNIWIASVIASAIVAVRAPESGAAEACPLIALATVKTRGIR